jgi:putative NADH-flavin reductase
MTKKIALLGGSGQTGQEFLTRALAQGYTIQALARDPNKIPQKSSLLTVIPGDVLHPEDVAQVVADTDVVVSLFGHVKGSPAWLQTRGTEHIVEAMQAHQVPRIISLSGGGLPFPEKDQPKLTDKMIRTLMQVAVPKVLNDAVRHHQVLQQSGLAWTIVRGPRLTHDSYTGEYRVGWVGVNASTKVGRADLADFILKLVEDESYDYQMPLISY